MTAQTNNQRGQYSPAADNPCIQRLITHAADSRHCIDFSANSTTLILDPAHFWVSHGVVDLQPGSGGAYRNAKSVVIAIL